MQHGDEKGTLCSSGGDDIDVFDDGTLQDNSTPAAWSVPAGTLGDEETYGHLGYGATDLTLDDLNGGERLIVLPAPNLPVFPPLMRRFYLTAVRLMARGWAQMLMARAM